MTAVDSEGTVIGTASFNVGWTTIGGQNEDIIFNVGASAELSGRDDFTEDDSLMAMLCWTDSNECHVAERTAGNEADKGTINNFVVNSEVLRTWS